MAGSAEVKINASWKPYLEAEFAKPYFLELTDFVRSEYATKTVYPPPKLIFNAFEHCDFEEVKVVILGQDPYHNPDQAMGLSFSVPEGVTIPPSLQNIYKEIHADLADAGKEEWLQVPELKYRNGDLSSWAEQGVLLLNATLTVVKNTPGSHQNKGWEQFTDEVIKQLAAHKQNLVVMLWGSYARQKGGFLDRQQHKVLEAPHPSPFSARNGFFGCRHFSQANSYLIHHGHEPIIW